MAEKSNKIDQLSHKLENLLKMQESFSREVGEIREEINRLKNQEKGDVKANLKSKETRSETDAMQPVSILKTGDSLQESAAKEGNPWHIRQDIEKFIGENLINKIGIVITVIGVAIGAKYAIEHQLISPLARIILGYLVGFGLLFFAYRLKKKYENFSSVLLSGSMAIIYFITYSAYSFYDLIPQLFAFILMIIITAFTVTAAINYNKQVIAHIGLVGAYAVPFLLSEGSTNVLVLFSYTAIINIGILIIAFKKYWKPLYYSSFLITWLMYLMWFVSKYQADEHLGLASVFLTIFFVTFYLMFLTYKLIQLEKFDIYDILLLLTNSFIFYGIGYNILSVHDKGEHLLGLFTLCNAIVHSIASLFIYRQKLADRNLFYLISGLVFIFITISIPVQLNGSWVTLLWAGEAALLFWIGRTKNVSFYEILSYGLMFLAFFSLLHDWSPVSNIIDPEQPGTHITPLLNIRFMTALLFIVSFGFINILNHNPRYSSPLHSQDELLKVISFSITASLLKALYFSFRMEISTYWDQLFRESLMDIKVEGQESLAIYRDFDLPNFKIIWILNYTLLFFSITSFVNIKQIKSHTWGLINLASNTIAVAVFLIQGLYLLSELRESYLDQALNEYYNRGVFNIGIRYISFVFVGILMVSSYVYVRQEFLKPVSVNLKIAFDILLYTSLIWILSSELLSWFDIMEVSQSYKIALSILWGMYALFIIGLGIWKKKKHLRIGAIVLFAATLIKLFFYDISHLDTISKTIVFVTLGILLLIISFLYNKYRNIISSEVEDSGVK